MNGLVGKLLGCLNRPWRKDPAQVLALRLTCNGSDLKWSIVNSVLTTVPIGGTALPLAVNLSLYTLSSLSIWLSDQPGYQVPYQPPASIGALSAYALFDQSGDTGQSNGDHLYAFMNPTYSILGAYAIELAAAQAQIVQMLLQMVIQTASGEWLDFQGTYYAVPRMVGEPDSAYAARIIPTVLLPKSNNTAIANLIYAVFGQPVQVIDVVERKGLEPLFDGSPTFNGADKYNATSHTDYCLFDVMVGQDILGAGDPLPTALLTQIINQVRAAGTQLLSVTGTPSQISDVAPLPSDAASITVTTVTRFDGAHYFDGSPTYVGTVIETDTLLDVSSAQAPATVAPSSSSIGSLAIGVSGI